MLRRAVPAAVLPLLLAVLIGDPALAQQPKRGGVLRIADREAPNLDPHLSISTARLSLLRAGKVDIGHMWGFMMPEEAKSLEQTNPEMVMTPVMNLASAILYFRTDQPPFNDMRVRRAISLAIDRKSWNDSLHYGEGCIDAGPVPCAFDGLEAGGLEDGPGEGPVPGRVRPSGGQAPPGGGGLPEGLHHAHVPLARLCAALADLLRPRRRQPREDRRHRRVQARGIR